MWLRERAFERGIASDKTLVLDKCCLTKRNGNLLAIIEKNKSQGRDVL